MFVMSKPKRNDPCPCGSGKKYKKCCGANKVIEFNPGLYNNELEQLNMELMDFAVTHFNDRLVELSHQYVEAYLSEGDEEEVDAYLPLLTAWIVLKEPIKNNKTIFDVFYNTKKDKIKHPRTKNVFSSWRDEAHFSVFKIEAVEDHPVPHMILQDLKNFQTYQSLFNDDLDYEIGNIVAGALIPYVNMHDFLYSMLQFPAEEKESILTVLDEIELNKEELPEIYPEFLANILKSEDDFTLKWFDERHKMTAQLFADHMLAKNFSEQLIQSGVLFWNFYCLRKNPDIKKPGAHAAALEYLIQLTFVEGATITQSQVAKEYNTNAGTVSANYRKMAKEMASQIDEFDLLNSDIIEQTTPSATFPSDPRNMGTLNSERDLLAIQNLLSEKEFATSQEASDYINDLLASGTMPSTPQEPRYIAQEIIHEALSKHGNEQTQLIEQALDIYPNSPDAYLLLAEKASTPQAYRKRVQQAVKAGEKDLGEEYFQENKGHFWGLVETRPYMRAKAAYAISLEQAGFDEEAIKQYEELLELNPNDNQGIREVILPLYIQCRDFKSINKLFNAYKDDITAAFLFSKALVSYFTEGLSAQSIRLLKKADTQNPYVVDYLLGNKQIPEQEFEYIGLGDEREAIVYAQDNAHLWADAKDLLKTLTD